MNPRRAPALALAAVVVWLAGCGGDGPEVRASPVATDRDALAVAGGSDWVSTVARSGNHHVAIPTGLTHGEPVHVRHELPTAPTWLVSAPVDRGVLHVLTDGQRVVLAIILGDREPEVVEPGLLGPAPTGRPALVASDGRWQFTVPPAPTNGEPAVPLDDGTVGWVDGDATVHLGDLTVAEALPDARLAVSADGRVAWLAAPTNRYGHGVLGDELEAGRIVVADPAAGAVVDEVGLDPGVVEGTGVLWADIDGNGRDDLLYTHSRTGEGAGLVVLRDDGTNVAGPTIGASGRWRHQIAVAPGPDGVPEVVEVVTPHLARVATWWRAAGDELVVANEVDGAVASHTIGSRNLDQAVVVDLTGDGLADLVGPGPQGGLVLVDRSGGTRVLLDHGTVVTNLTATVSGSRVQLAAATDGVLHVFQWGP